MSTANDSHLQRPDVRLLGGYFVFTEMFLPGKRRDAAHNVVRGWNAYRPALMAPNRARRVVVLKWATG